ncbi:MAG: HNH endonuclease [Blastocatellia bacterium]
MRRATARPAGYGSHIGAMNPHYPSVAKRANHRCEYCGAPEAIFNFRFEVEHIRPISREGVDEESNLALACRSCNIHKSNWLTAIDPVTQTDVPLFNPREQAWQEHFQLDLETAMISGLSPIGRAAVERLRMNSPVQLTARIRWTQLGLLS